MLSDIGDEFMDPLSFSADLFPSDSNISLLDIIRQKTFLKKFDYSEGLINEFENQGYVENETLFTFPYDWRYGVSGKYADGSTNSDLLAQKIESILQQTKAEKVDVIAHSMGGLIVKKYVFDTAASAQGSGVPKIGKAVFAGVPNTGAPKAVKSLISGDNFGIPWLSEKEMKKISKNMPAGYDLLPSQQYYNAKGSFVQIINEINLTTENLSEQNTTKDLNYEETKSFLINDHGLNLQAEENAESLHAADFDNFDLRTAGIDLYSINGCKAGTFSKIIENRFENGLGATVVSYKAPQFSPGDGTVPLESATNLPISDSNKFYSLTGDHGKMLSQDGTRQEIVNLIAGSNLSTGSNLITQDIAQCNLNGKAISVFSPVNIFVTDQDGNKMGLADDESIINEIPNASFEILGERKFIYLPTDNGQVYTISLTGTGEGTFTIKSEDIQNSQTTKTEVFSNLPVTLEMTGSVNINLADNSTNLNIKQSETSDEQIILASFVLDEEQSKDLLPPMSVATLAGELEAPGVYKSSVEISVKATDENSGVFSLHYNLDNLGLVDFLGSSLVETVSLTGSHVFKFFSTDNAGNNEQEKTINFEIILPPEPEPEPEPEPQITPSVLPLPSGGGAGGGGGNNYLPVETVQPPLSLEPTEPALITHNNESEKIPEAREVLVYDVQTQIPAPVATKALQIEKPEKQEIVLQGISQPIATAGLSANKNFLQYILDWFLKIWNKLLNVVK
jgi:triacylglycerol esterase/lipase EstA (alpha/beta hydrolase family)